jgi:hypothetical protein
MRANVAVLAVAAVLLARPAFADGVAERVAALRVRFDEGRPQGRAFQQSVGRNLGILRDLTSRANRAGLDLPPVIIKGAPTLLSRKTIGFHRTEIPYALRASVMVKPRLMIINLETRDLDSETWHPSEDHPPIVKKLPRLFGGRALSRALIDVDVGREHVEEAFDAWTQAVEAGTHPAPRLRFVEIPAALARRVKATRVTGREPDRAQPGAPGTEPFPAPR